MQTPNMDAINEIAPSAVHSNPSINKGVIKKARPTPKKVAENAPLFLRVSFTQTVLFVSTSRLRCFLRLAGTNMMVACFCK
jgi:hypothetical protein